MNLNKIGFWAISTTAFLVTLVMGLDYLVAQGVIQQSSKCTIVTWSIILMAIFVSIKLLSMFERLNNEVQSVKSELEYAQLELDNFYLENLRQSLPNSLFAGQYIAGSNVIPFPLSVNE